MIRHKASLEMRRRSYRVGPRDLVEAMERGAKIKPSCSAMSIISADFAGLMTNEGFSKYMEGKPRLTPATNRTYDVIRSLVPQI